MNSSLTRGIRAPGRGTPCGVRADSYDPAMAFKTRTGRTIAVGHGTMLAALSTWRTGMVSLLGPTGVVLLYVVWFTAPSTRSWVNWALPYALALSLLGLLAFLLVALTFGTAFGAMFVGPHNNNRDHLMALLESRTARWGVLVSLLLILLMPALRFPFGEFRFIAIATLTVALCFASVRVDRGLACLTRASGATAYYEGMSPAEKALLGKGGAALAGKSFPHPEELEEATDARLYAGRAHGISEGMTWAGAGLIFVFSAFIGMTISAMWESRDPVTQFPAFIVLGFVALGFWLQRRARQFQRLADAFERRSDELEAKIQQNSLFERLRAAFRPRIAKETKEARPRI